MSTAPDRLQRAGARLITVLGVLLLLVLLGGGAWFYRTQEQEMKGEAEAQLEAIARLKVDQIVAWRRERLANAANITERPALIADIRQYFTTGSSKAAEETLRRFDSLRKQYRYRDVVLVDLEGRERLSLAGYAGVHHAGASSALSEALRERTPVFTELHTEEQELTPHISVVAPLFFNHGEVPEPLGAVILVCDAREFLFPVIQAWPVPSRTAETLLVRRDGNDVLFLNDLRHRPDTSLQLRIPLSRKEVPAVMAVLGQEGVFEGRDYRGVEVLAVIKAIPASPWFMVAKVDAEEAFAAWRFRSVLILLVLSGAGALLVVGMLLSRQRDSKAHYRALYLSEAARRRSEERHGVTLKSIGDAVIATDAGGRVELLNPVAEALTGWTEVEARGRPIDEVFSIINEITRQPVNGPIERVLREGLVVGLANHTVLMARDGAERPIADSGAPIRDEQGAVSGAVLVFRDQTEERAAIEALRASEARFRQLFDIVPMPLCFVDEEGNLKTFNRHFLQTFGYSQQDVPKLREWSKLAYPDPEYRRWVSHAWRNAMLSAMQNKSDIEPMELRVTCKNGKVRTMVVTGSTVGESFLAAFFDITERQRAEETVRQERDFSRSALDSLPGLFYLFDEQGRFLRWNRNFERVSGYTAEEISRLSPWDLIDEPDKGRVGDRIREAFQTGESYVEADFMSKDGSKTPYYLTGNLFRFEDKACLLGMGIDISERKRVEQDREELRVQLNQAQKMESVGRLAGGVAHDYNNMLGVIIGYAGMALARLDPNDPLHADLEQVLKAARRSADLTRQLLAFARKQTIAPRPLDLNETVGSMLKMLHRLIGEDIDLAWLPGHELWSVRMDPVQIDQILANLCVNARDAIRGVGKVTIETGNVSIDRDYCASHAGFSPGDYVVLAVSDDGCGMDVKTQESIFEPFFTTKEVGQGTGLGLATVYGIVRQNDGSIHVYSEPGKGTTFKIYLPRHEGEVAAVSSERSGEISPSLGETVLLVEDDAAVMRMAHMMLERLGYRVLTANTPKEAMRLADEFAGSIDLLITDVVMPEMNGRELARQLQALHPKLKVTYMSGYTANAIVHRGELEPGTHFIPKPFSLRDLAGHVRAVLDA